MNDKIKYIKIKINNKLTALNKITLQRIGQKSLFQSLKPTLF